METWAIPWLLLVGGMLAVQAAANVQLSGAMRSPIGASTLQLAVASGLLLAATAAIGTLGAFVELGWVTPWHLLGGLGSAVYITAGILLFPRLGALVTVGLFITGQMAASLVLDTFGWLGVRAEPLYASTVAGVLAVLAGAAVIVRAQSATAATAATPGNASPPRMASAATRLSTARSPMGSSPPASESWPTAVTSAVVSPVPTAARWGWLVLGLLAGAVLPVQGAINAQLRADLQAPIAVAAFSFLLATLAMGVVLVLVVRVGRVPRPQLAGLRTVPWWGWLGGLAGAVYVTSVFLLIPSIGAATTIALTVAGQQLASVAVDQYGLLRLPRRVVTARRLAGVVVMLAGVALLQLG